MKPILFDTKMVRAILEDRKTETRRVVKPQPPATSVVRKRGGSWDWSFWADCDMGHLIRPPYQPGDILWVRETWWKNYGHKYGTYFYRADGEEIDIPLITGGTRKHGKADGLKWRPSIHMPKEAARLFLRVTGVRVERLQDGFFTQGDTIAALYDEGIDIGEQCRQCIENYGNPCCNDLDPELEPDENGEDENGGSECGILDEVRSDFARLWDSTIKPADLPLYGWEANPWVWVIEFERISKEAALSGGGGDVT